MSRFTLLLLGSALMLIVAACDVNGDDDAADDITDDAPAVQTEDDVAGEDDIATEDDEQVQSRDAEVGDDPDADAVPVDDEDGIAQDNEVVEQEDDTAIDDEAMALDDDEIAEPGEDEMMDPNQGMFFDLTFDEANEMTDYELREPGMVPEAVELQMIIGVASMEATAEEMENQAATVVFSYEQPAEDEMSPGIPLEYTQSSEIDMSAGIGPDVDDEQVTIGDRDVTRIEAVQQTGEPVIAFAWQEDGIYFSVAAVIEGNIEESDLEEMVASIPTA